MLEILTKGFKSAHERLSGVRELTEQNVDEALRDVRMSLLEADVDFQVVKDFLGTGEETLDRLEAFRPLRSEPERSRGRASRRNRGRASARSEDLMRSDGGALDQLRPVRLVTDFTENPLASVLCEFGATKVLCTVGNEETVPRFQYGTARPPRLRVRRRCGGQRLTARGDHLLARQRDPRGARCIARAGLRQLRHATHHRLKGCLAEASPTTARWCAGNGAPESSGNHPS